MADNSGGRRAVATCAMCKKPGTGLRTCAKCHSAQYCNRHCQRAHHKAHSKACAQLATESGAARSSTTNTAPPSASATPSSTSHATTSSSPAHATAARPKSLDAAIPNPFHRLQDRTWLHGRSRPDTYTLLIDAYRLRVHDEHKHHGNVDHDSILSGNVSSGFAGFAGFAHFLATMRWFTPDLFPAWWDAQSEHQCKMVGMSRGWEDLRVVLSEADFKARYAERKLHCERQCTDQYRHDRPSIVSISSKHPYCSK
ncbi:uncharacterized protein K452DRAFT_307387 [Aplosporella prunicola CBS 121167]|uniref:MYND-type domain-containing protein n=1 Tax=Aplosporella prunicola CBS 121167 TaxID=1176127 RepID=A0A6A6BIV8_9PEZI|nr:uncharacterized protein K452DRAFT_307387 [Aplosporella prunicola CBS 121167]KAF2143214.1 hypothetical protein K452DRAFT_307387 [Aplosporella prunicola CBS 121167]